MPPNCRFLIEDAQLPWNWPPNHFDFIHARHLTGCVDNWPRLYNRAFERLRPGGYFEHCDYDIATRSDTGLVCEDHVFTRWREVLIDASAANGRSFEGPTKGGDIGMQGLMSEAGFVDVVHRCWKVPIGAWPQEKRMKQLGLFTYEFLDQSLEGFALLLLREVMGWSYEEVQGLVADMRKALRRSRLMPYFTLWVLALVWVWCCEGMLMWSRHLTYGRKPG